MTQKITQAIAGRTITLPAGRYLASRKFIEPWQKPNRRVFTVNITRLPDDLANNSGSNFLGKKPVMTLDGFTYDEANNFLSEFNNGKYSFHGRVLKQEVAPTSSFCDCFEPGQVWESPRGSLYAVTGYVETPGKRKQAVLRLGMDGKGRKQLRDWDAVVGWVIFQEDKE